MRTLNFAFACGVLIAAQLATAAPPAERDEHSYANTRQFQVENASLDLTVDFQQRQLAGAVILSIRRLDPSAREIVLDTRDLVIRKVELIQAAQPKTLEFTLGERDKILGSPLRIAMGAAAANAVHQVRIEYLTSPDATGLQWVKPEQTAGKQQPFLYSQSQAIHARSWIPLQDTPQVRQTYDARIRTPVSLLAVMSASNDVEAQRDGDYSFAMPQAIPSYLFALAVGDIAFKSVGARTGVYAEPAVVNAASKEFEDVQAMLDRCEQLFGPYRWGRYDLLILPPSFPWGGMENPRLSFITPSVLAGDKSLVALIAHELAHSWSGNLVTNATWNDVWLNEGFTVYLERRIMEALYGVERRSLEDALGLQSLRRDMDRFTADDEAALTRLHVNLKGRDPDDGFSDVPYEKGRLFLGFLEARLGRTTLDALLRDYFQKFAFQSIDTQMFRDYLQGWLKQHPQARVNAAEIETWFEGEGLPAEAVLPTSNAFTDIDKQTAAWLAGGRTAALGTTRWTTQQWLHFLDNLPATLTRAQMTDLDKAFRLSEVRNSEIAHSWLLNVIRTDYEPGYARLDQYLNTIGRRKLVKDLYEALLKSPAGAQRARGIYAKARPMYHVVLTAQLDALMQAGVAD